MGNEEFGLDQKEKLKSRKTNRRSESEKIARLMLVVNI